jgi:hypothetical protein
MIINQMFLQKGKLANKTFCCPGSEYRYTDNDYKANFLQSNRTAGKFIFFQRREDILSAND